MTSVPAFAAQTMALVSLPFYYQHGLSQTEAMPGLLMRQLLKERLQSIGVLPTYKVRERIMKRLFAAGTLALTACLAIPALAQTVIVTPGAEAPPSPPPPPPSTVVVTPPPPEPVTECEKTTTTKDRVIGSKTETSTHCRTTAPAP